MHQLPHRHLEQDQWEEDRDLARLAQPYLDPLDLVADSAADPLHEELRAYTVEITEHVQV